MLSLAEVSALDLSDYDCAAGSLQVRGKRQKDRCVVIADDRRAVLDAWMQDAADLVQIDYEPQPAVSYAEDAIAPDAPIVHSELGTNICYTLKREGGDVETAFREADKIVHVRVDSPRVAPIPMEPRGVVAEPGTSPKLTLWISSQAPHGARADLARVLGMRPEDVRVIAPDVGGAFGAKSGATPEYILAGYFALKLERPVKWVATRSEDIVVTNFAVGDG